jgi:hypothetical protein
MQYHVTGPFVSALKGQDDAAQGNALGFAEHPHDEAL